MPEKYFVTLWGHCRGNSAKRVTLITMNTLSSTNSRRLMWAAFLLLLPGVFMRYAAIGYNWSDPSVWIDFAANSSGAFQGLMLYVAVFFTLFVKGDRTWKHTSWHLLQFTHCWDFSLRSLKRRQQIYLSLKHYLKASRPIIHITADPQWKTHSRLPSFHCSQ